MSTHPSLSQNGNARRKLEFQNSPVQEKKFYLDIPKQSTLQLQDKLYKAISSIGGQVETFLSKDVDLVITLKAARDTFDENSKRESSRLDRLSSISSRGAALLLKAKQSLNCNANTNTKRTSNTSDILSNARNLGVKVEHATSFLKRVKKYVISTPDHTKVFKKKRQSDDLSDIKPITWNDTNVFLKIENSSQEFKPLSKKFDSSTFPKIFYSDSEASPYDGHILKKRAPKKCTEKKNKNPMEAKNGFCEMCNYWYKCTLNEHVKSDVHCKFVTDDEAFSSLDKLIFSVSSVNNFLQKYIHVNDSETTESENNIPIKEKYQLPEEIMTTQDISFKENISETPTPECPMMVDSVCKFRKDKNSSFKDVSNTNVYRNSNQTSPYSTQNHNKLHDTPLHGYACTTKSGSPSVSNIGTENSLPASDFTHLKTDFRDKCSVDRVLRKCPGIYRSKCRRLSSHIMNHQSTPNRNNHIDTDNLLLMLQKWTLAENSPHSMLVDELSSRSSRRASGSSQGCMILGSDVTSPVVFSDLKQTSSKLSSRHATKYVLPSPIMEDICNEKLSCINGVNRNSFEGSQHSKDVKITTLGTCLQEQILVPVQHQSSNEMSNAGSDMDSDLATENYEIPVVEGSQKTKDVEISTLETCLQEQIPVHHQITNETSNAGCGMDSDLGTENYEIPVDIKHFPQAASSLSTSRQLFSERSEVSVPVYDAYGGKVHSVTESDVPVHQKSSEIFEIVQLESLTIEAANDTTMIDAAEAGTEGGFDTSTEKYDMPADIRIYSQKDNCSSTFCSSHSSNVYTGMPQLLSPQRITQVPASYGSPPCLSSQKNINSRGSYILDMVTKSRPQLTEFQDNTCSSVRSRRNVLKDMDLNLVVANTGTQPPINSDPNHCDGNSDFKTNSHSMISSQTSMKNVNLVQTHLVNGTPSGRVGIRLCRKNNCLTATPISSDEVTHEQKSSNKPTTTKKKTLRKCLFGKDKENCPVEPLDPKPKQDVYMAKKTSDTKLHIKKCKNYPRMQSTDLKMYWRVRKAGDCRLVFSAEKRKLNHDTENSDLNDSMMNNQDCKRQRIR